MPSRPILQACAKSVGPSPSICSASAANAGFVFVLLQRVTHALGVGEGCAVTASYPEVRIDHHHANSFRTAPSLCADMIFGKDTDPCQYPCMAHGPVGCQTGGDVATGDSEKCAIGCG